MGDSILGGSDSERGLGVIVDNQLNVSSQHESVAKRANAILGCINRGSLSRREVLLLP